MSLSDVVVKGEAIESDDDCDLGHDHKSGQIVVSIRLYFDMVSSVF